MSKHHTVEDYQKIIKYGKFFMKDEKICFIHPCGVELTLLDDTLSAHYLHREFSEIQDYVEWVKKERQVDPKFEPWHSVKNE